MKIVKKNQELKNQKSLQLVASVHNGVLVHHTVANKAGNQKARPQINHVVLQLISGVVLQEPNFQVAKEVTLETQEILANQATQVVEVGPVQQTHTEYREEPVIHTQVQAQRVMLVSAQATTQAPDQSAPQAASVVSLVGLVVPRVVEDQVQRLVNVLQEHMDHS
jgi:hypothetical protein